MPHDDLSALTRWLFKGRANAFGAALSSFGSSRASASRRFALQSHFAGGLQ